MRSSLFIRIISVGLIVTLITTNSFSVSPVFAAPAAAPSGKISGLSKIKIPESFGKISELYQGDPSGQTVVLIQDAHSIPEAQSSIRKLVEHFYAGYGVRQVGLEGASEKLDTRLFKSFPDKDKLKKVFEEYHERGELPGAVAAAILSSPHEDLVLQGLEDWTLYEKGLSLYLQAIRQEPEILQVLETKIRGLRERKKSVYSEKLFEADLALEKFQENHEGLAEVLQKLASVALPAKGGAVAMLLEELQSNRGHWGKDEQKRERKLSEMSGRFEHEFKAYAKQVKESLFRNREERELDRQSRELYLLKKLTKLELTKEEWEEIKKVTSDKSQVTDDMSLFYQTAEERDRVFFANLQKMISCGDAVVVAGGFHSQGLTGHLKAAGISYVLVMPALKSVPETTSYRDQMQGRFSWSSYFKVKNGQVNLFDAFVRATRDKLLEETGDRRQVTGDMSLVTRHLSLLKLWRDEIIRSAAKTGEIETAGRHTKYLDEITGDIQDDFHSKWVANVRRFAAGMQKLDQSGRLTQANVLKLFQPSANVPLSVASFQSGAAVFADRVGLGQLQPSTKAVTSRAVNLSSMKHLLTSLLTGKGSLGPKGTNVNEEGSSTETASRSEVRSGIEEVAVGKIDADQLPGVLWTLIAEKRVQDRKNQELYYQYRNEKIPQGSFSEVLINLAQDDKDGEMAYAVSPGRVTPVLKDSIPVFSPMTHQKIHEEAKTKSKAFGYVRNGVRIVLSFQRESGKPINVLMAPLLESDVSHFKKDFLVAAEILHRSFRQAYDENEADAILIRGGHWIKDLYQILESRGADSLSLGYIVKELIPSFSEIRTEEHPFEKVTIVGGTEEDQKQVREYLREMAPKIPVHHAELLETIRIKNWAFLVAGRVTKSDPKKINLLMNRFVGNAWRSNLIHELGHVVQNQTPLAQTLWKQHWQKKAGYDLAVRSIAVTSFSILFAADIAVAMVDGLYRKALLNLLFAGLGMVLFLLAEIPQYFLRSLLRIFGHEIPFVSLYAMSNDHEDFAESYRNYVLNRDDFRALAEKKPIVMEQYRDMEKIFETPRSEVRAEGPETVQEFLKHYWKTQVAGPGAAMEREVNERLKAEDFNAFKEGHLPGSRPTEYDKKLRQMLKDFFVEYFQSYPTDGAPYLFEFENKPVVLSDLLRGYGLTIIPGISNEEGEPDVFFYLTTPDDQKGVYLAPALDDAIDLLSVVREPAERVRYREESVGLIGAMLLMLAAAGVFGGITFLFLLTTRFEDLGLLFSLFALAGSVIAGLIWANRPMPSSSFGEEIIPQINSLKQKYEKEGGVLWQRHLEFLNRSEVRGLSDQLKGIEQTNPNRLVRRIARDFLEHPKESSVMEQFVLRAQAYEKEDVRLEDLKPEDRGFYEAIRQSIEKTASGLTLERKLSPAENEDLKEIFRDYFEQFHAEHQSFLLDDDRNLSTRDWLYRENLNYDVVIGPFDSKTGKVQVRIKTLENPSIVFEVPADDLEWLHFLMGLRKNYQERLEPAHHRGISALIFFAVSFALSFFLSGISILLAAGYFWLSGLLAVFVAGWGYYRTRLPFEDFGIIDRVLSFIAEIDGHDIEFKQSKAAKLIQAYAASLPGAALKKEDAASTAIKSVNPESSSSAFRSEKRITTIREFRWKYLQSSRTIPDADVIRDLHRQIDAGKFDDPKLMPHMKKLFLEYFKTYPPEGYPYLFQYEDEVVTLGDIMPGYDLVIMPSIPHLFGQPAFFLRITTPEHPEEVVIAPSVEDTLGLLSLIKESPDAITKLAQGRWPYGIAAAGIVLSLGIFMFQIISGENDPLAFILSSFLGIAVGVMLLAGFKLILNSGKLHPFGEEVRETLDRLIERYPNYSSVRSGQSPNAPDTSLGLDDLRSEMRAAFDAEKVLKETTDAGSAGTHNMAYYRAHTRPRIVDDVQNGRYVLLRYRENEFEAELGPKAAALDPDLMQRILAINKSKIITDLLTANKENLKHLKIYLLEPENDTRTALHRHLITSVGRDFEVAFSRHDKGSSQVVYMTRSAFTDLDTRLLADILANQITLAIARYQFWHKNPKEHFPFGKFGKKTHALLERIGKNKIIKDQIQETHQKDQAIHNTYQMDKHYKAVNILKEVLEKIAGEMPDFAPARTLAKYAESFLGAVMNDDMDTAVKWWGLLTYEIKDLEMRGREHPESLIAQFVGFPGMDLIKHYAVGLNQTFKNYIYENGVFNQDGEEYGKVVGKVIVIDDVKKVGEAFTKFGYERKEPIIWVLPYLPDRYDQIPGEGVIISVAVNRHAADTAKEQSIPLAIIPNATELLKAYDGQIGMLRVNEDRDVRFRLAHPDEEGVPRPKSAKTIMVPKARVDGPSIYRLGDIDENFIPFVGPKAASLGKMMAAGIKVPDGMVLSFNFWERFQKHNQLNERIAPHWQKIQTKNGRIINSDEELDRILEEIRKLVLDAEFSPDLTAELDQAVRDLRKDHSFEELDHDLLLRYIKLVFASKYKPQPVRLRIRNNTPDEEVLPAVILQIPKEARYAGTMYTADPTSKDRNLVAVMASHGQGAAVVGEDGYPAEARINKISEEVQVRYKESRIDQKYEMIHKNFFYVRSSFNFEDLIEFRTAGFYESYPDKTEKAEGKAPIKGAEVSLSERETPILTDELMKRLKEYGEKIEALYDYRPQDIEWALDKEGELWFVQSRPMKMDKLPAENTFDKIILAQLGEVELVPLQAMKSAEKRNSFEELLPYLQMDSAQEAGDMSPAAHIQQVVAARYVGPLGNNAETLRRLRLEHVKQMIQFLEKGGNIGDTSVAAFLLMFLRLAGMETKNTEIRTAIEKAFTESAVFSKGGISHSQDLEISKARAAFGNYSLALVKLRSAAQNAAWVDVADRTIRVLATIPLEFSGPLLESYAASSERVPVWVNEFALRVIDRLSARSEGRSEMRQKLNAVKVHKLLQEIDSGLDRLEEAFEEIDSRDYRTYGLKIDEFASGYVRPVISALQNLPAQIQGLEDWVISSESWAYRDKAEAVSKRAEELIVYESNLEAKLAARKLDPVRRASAVKDLSAAPKILKALSEALKIENRENYFKENGFEILEAEKAVRFQLTHGLWSKGKISLPLEKSPRLDFPRPWLNKTLVIREEASAAGPDRKVLRVYENEIRPESFLAVYTLLEGRNYFRGDDKVKADSEYKFSHPLFPGQTFYISTRRGFKRDQEQNHFRVFVNSKDEILRITDGQSQDLVWYPVWDDFSGKPSGALIMRSEGVALRWPSLRGVVKGLPIYREKSKRGEAYTKAYFTVVDPAEKKRKKYYLAGAEFAPKSGTSGKADIQFEGVTPVKVKIKNKNFSLILKRNTRGEIIETAKDGFYGKIGNFTGSITAFKADANGRASLGAPLTGVQVADASGKEIWMSAALESGVILRTDEWTSPRSAAPYEFKKIENGKYLMETAFQRSKRAHLFNVLRDFTHKPLRSYKSRLSLGAYKDHSGVITGIEIGLHGRNGRVSLPDYDYALPVYYAGHPLEIYRFPVEKKILFVIYDKNGRNLRDVFFYEDGGTEIAGDWKKIAEQEAALKQQYGYELDLSELWQVKIKSARLFERAQEAYKRGEFDASEKIFRRIPRSAARKNYTDAAFYLDQLIPKKREILASGTPKQKKRIEREAAKYRRQSESRSELRAETQAPPAGAEFTNGAVPPVNLEYRRHDLGEGRSLALQGKPGSDDEKAAFYFKPAAGFFVLQGQRIQGEWHRWIEIDLNTREVKNFRSFWVGKKPVYKGEFPHRNLEEEYFAQIQAAVLAISELAARLPENFEPSLNEIRKLIGNVFRAVPRPDTVSLYFESGKEIVIRVVEDQPNGRVYLIFPFSEDPAKQDPHQFVLRIDPNNGQNPVSINMYVTQVEEGILKKGISAFAEPGHEVRADNSFVFEDEESFDGYEVRMDDLRWALADWYENLPPEGRSPLLEQAVKTLDNLFPRQDPGARSEERGELERTVKIVNPKGLHMLPLSTLAELAERIESKTGVSITIKKNSSSPWLLPKQFTTLPVIQDGEEIIVRVTGKQSQEILAQAMDWMEKILKNPGIQERADASFSQLFNEITQYSFRSEPLVELKDENNIPLWEIERKIDGLEKDGEKEYVLEQVFPFTVDPKTGAARLFFSLLSLGFFIEIPKAEIIPELSRIMNMVAIVNLKSGRGETNVRFHIEEAPDGKSGKVIYHFHPAKKEEMKEKLAKLKANRAVFYSLSPLLNSQLFHQTPFFSVRWEREKGWYRLRISPVFQPDYQKKVEAFSRDAAQTISSSASESERVLDLFVQWANEINRLSLLHDNQIAQLAALPKIQRPEFAWLTPALEQYKLAHKEFAVRSKAWTDEGNKILPWIEQMKGGPETPETRKLIQELPVIQQKAESLHAKLLELNDIIGFALYELRSETRRAEILAPVQVIKRTAAQLAPGVKFDQAKMTAEILAALISVFQQGDLEAQLIAQVDILETQAKQALFAANIQSGGMVGVALSVPAAETGIWNEILRGALNALNKKDLEKLLKSGRLSEEFTKGLAEREIPIQPVRLYQRLTLEDDRQPVIPFALLGDTKAVKNPVFQFLSIQNIDALKNDPDALRWVGKLMMDGLKIMAELSKDEALRTDPVKLREELAKQLLKNYPDRDHVVSLAQNGGTSLFGIDAVAARAAYQAEISRRIETAA